MHSAKPSRHALPYRIPKRLIDLVVSAVLLLLASPLLLAIGIAIAIDSTGPVIFVQKRVGEGKSHFRILKFRTMRVDAPRETPTHLVEDAGKHITRMGRILRKTSLDELPQLLNIMAGSMSFVGPRPALWNQFDLIAERDRYGANDIKPGLTGWAQINGRDELPIATKARLDGEYVRNMSFGMDMRCMARTFRTVLRGEGVIEGREGPKGDLR